MSEQPEIAEAAVVGEPHPVRGEVPVAYVVAAPHGDIDTAALEARCREKLADIRAASSEFLESILRRKTKKFLPLQLSDLLSRSERSRHRLAAHFAKFRFEIERFQVRRSASHRKPDDTLCLMRKIQRIRRADAFLFFARNRPGK